MNSKELIGKVNTNVVSRIVVIYYGIPVSMSKASPRFLCRPTAFFDLLEPWDVSELYIRKTADLPMQFCFGTFPRFVAIGFYFLSETLI